MKFTISLTGLALIGSTVAAPVLGPMSGFPAPSGGFPPAPTGWFPVPTGWFPAPSGGFPAPSGTDHHHHHHGHHGHHPHSTGTGGAFPTGAALPFERRHFLPSGIAPSGFSPSGGFPAPSGMPSGFPPFPFPTGEVAPPPAIGRRQRHQPGSGPAAPFLNGTRSGGHHGFPPSGPPPPPPSGTAPGPFIPGTGFPFPTGFPAPSGFPVPTGFPKA